MSLPIISVAAPDATRIAQTVVHRDLQTQVLVTAQSRRHTDEARRLPAATKGTATRDRFRRAAREEGVPADAEGTAPVTARRPPGSLDLLA